LTQPRNASIYHEEVIRIISARKADRDEIEQYQWWL